VILNISIIFVEFVCNYIFEESSIDAFFSSKEI